MTAPGAPAAALPAKAWPMACWACCWPVALPLYVILPNHYARSSACRWPLGAVLLAAPVSTPPPTRWAGWATGCSALHPHRCWARGPGGRGAGAGLRALFFPARARRAGPGWWLVAVAGRHLAYSQLSIAHRSWGACLGGDEAAQPHRGLARRLGLVGVVLASCFAACSACPPCWPCLRHAGAGLVGLGLRPARQGADMHGVYHRPAASLWRPGARRSAACWRCSCSTALPAPSRPRWCCSSCRTGYRRHPRRNRLFLGATSCAALSIPLWLRAVGRFGLAAPGSWACCWPWRVCLDGAAGHGDAIAFAVVCALSGVALGTDLALPRPCWPA